MYGEESPLQRLDRILRWSFPVGHLFGTEIRVFGTLGFVLLYSIYQVSKFESLFGVASLVAIASVVALYVVVLVHEFGHAFAGRRYRIFTPRITLSAFGGLAHLDSAAPHPRAEMFIAAAGPATHLLWLAVLWPLSLWLGEWHPDSGLWALYGRWFVLNLRSLNLYVMLFNLLPCYPMDGGRIFRALLATRMHPNRATLWAGRVGILGAAAFFAWGMVLSGFGGTLLMCIAISNFLACRGALFSARVSEGPYGAPRDAWAMDPEAWRRGGDPDPEDRPRRLRTGFFARLRSRRAAKKRDRALAAEPLPDFLPRRDPDDAQELDRLLARVSEVGISGLSEAERRSLLRLSEPHRGPR